MVASGGPIEPLAKAEMAGEGSGDARTDENTLVDLEKAETDGKDVALDAVDEGFEPGGTTTDWVMAGVLFSLEVRSAEGAATGPRAGGGAGADLLASVELTLLLLLAPSLLVPWDRLRVVLGCRRITSAVGSGCSS